MAKIMLRVWFVGTAIWLVYNLYLHRGELSSFKDRNWGAALDHGFRNFFCDLGASGLCKGPLSSFLQQTQMNETFGLLVTFVGVPLVFLLGCLVLAWIFHSDRR
jgi:hypothetical protein